MESVTINARFGTQEQAESALRKLRALRGDCFRIECHGASASADNLSSLQVEFATESDLAGESVRRRANEPIHLSDQTGGQSFTLSANMPDQAVDQARSVVHEAGGQLETMSSD